MALANVNKFNWEKFLSKIDNPEMKRRVNILRGKSNEIAASSAKYLKEPEPINFAAYQKKLKFTGSAVQALEAAYKNKSLPTYHATLPAFEAKKRAMISEVAKTVVDLAKADLKDLSAQLEEFEGIRINKDTSVNELNQRFPNFAKEVEQEIKHHEWAK